MRGKHNQKATRLICSFVEASGERAHVHSTSACLSHERMYAAGERWGVGDENKVS